MSANPSLQTANADIISLISSFAIAQESYNAALSRGETPSPPILARELTFRYMQPARTFDVEWLDLPVCFLH